MKKSTIIIVILAVFCLIITVRYNNLKSENEWLQRNVDEMFMSNFSSLHTDMMTITLNPDMTEEEMALYEEQTTKAGNMVSSLVISTSYKNNVRLVDLVRMLDQASGSDALYTITMTEEIEEYLTRMMLTRFDDKELIDQTYELIKAAIKKE